MNALDPARTATQPIYLGTGTDAAFAMYHAPTARDPVTTAVVLCPPWGWDEVSSYRARRVWAEDLAAGGHPTLRLDLPGTGDSGGSAGDPARLEAAASSIAAAVTWLRATSGCERVAVVGLGLGGIAAMLAVGADAPIDDLVLWAVPARGRGLVRQMRAFAGLQGSRFSLTGEPEPALLPDGWLEVNGFVMSAQTIAALERVVLADVSARGLQRALILEQDGIPTDQALATHLTAEDVEVTVRPGPGWAAMTFHPERPSVPDEVLTTVRGWLAEAVPHVVPLRALAPASPTPTIDLELTIDGVAITETPITIDAEGCRIFGILTRPAAASTTSVAGVLLNAGAVRRIGPNRIWVDTARSWAAHGVPTLRLDLEGIGDADGDHQRYRDVAEFYVRDELGVQIRQAIDALVVRGHGPRIVLAGLCAGGFWALRGAGADERVTAALLLNPGALDWHPDLVESRQAARVQRLRRIEWWRRMLGGGVSAGKILETVGALLRHGARAMAATPGRALERIVGRTSTHRDRSATASAILDRLSAADTTVVMAFSADEPLYDELGRDGFLGRVHRWRTLRLERLPGRDHTLRPIVAQRAARDLLDRELARELSRVSATVSVRSA